MTQRVRRSSGGQNPAHPEVLARDMQAPHLQLARRAAVMRQYAPLSTHQPEVHKQAGAPLHELRTTPFVPQPENLTKCLERDEDQCANTQDVDIPQRAVL